MTVRLQREPEQKLPTQKDPGLVGNIAALMYVCRLQLSAGARITNSHNGSVSVTAGVLPSRHSHTSTMKCFQNTLEVEYIGGCGVQLCFPSDLKLKKF